MKKQIGTSILLSVVLLSGCGVDKPATNTQVTVKASNEQVTTQSEQKNKAKLIGTSENKEVKLYEETDVVKLDVNGKVKNFNWPYYSSSVLNPPQVFYTDVIGDKDEKAVIIIHTGKGTGLDNYDIHVVNKDLTEIKVQSFEEIVANYIESKVVKKDDGTLGITVKAQGKESNFDYGFDPTPGLNQDELAFGGVVVYTLENQRIQLNLSGSVGVSPTYVADFNITYKFDSSKNEFTADQIEVKPIEK